MLTELAAVLLELGVTAALNLDGGSASALVTAGAMRNRPRNDEGEPLPEGYPTPTAFVFERRAAQR